MDTLHQADVIADKLTPVIGWNTGALLGFLLVTGQEKQADRIVETFPQLYELWQEVKSEFQR